MIHGDPAQGAGNHGQRGLKEEKGRAEKAGPSRELLIYRVCMPY